MNTSKSRITHPVRAERVEAHPIILSLSKDLSVQHG